LQRQRLFESLGIPDFSLTAKTPKAPFTGAKGLYAGAGARADGKATKPGFSSENPQPVPSVPSGTYDNELAASGVIYIKDPNGITYKWNEAYGSYMINKNYGGFIGKNMAFGGVMRGPGTPTSDSIPAMLSNGEYVIKASSVNKYGSGFMDAINAGSFAAGGMVKNYKSPIIAAYMSGGGFAAHTMMGYKDGGAVSSNIDNSSNDNYNIVINANDSNSAKIIADMVINRINRENSRKSHTRYIAGR